MMDSLSFDELGSWDDISDTVSLLENEDQHDPRNIDPRPTPQEIVDIDKSIVELEAELVRLKLRRDQVMADRALITRLPSELLSRIFELGVYGDSNLLLAISLVSHHWRSVALVTPSLWTYIVLDSQWGLTRIPAFMRRLRAHLERSQTCKLLVDLDINCIDNQELHDVMVVLRPEMARCYNFRVFAPCWDSLRLIRPYLTMLGPALEQLCMRASMSDIETPYHSLLGQPCLRLKTLVLQQLPLSCVDVEMPQLRRLELICDQQHRRSSNRRFGVMLKELLNTIARAPALEDLRLHSIVFLLDDSRHIFQETLQLTTMPSLCTLYFHTVDSLNILLFLESMHLPSLQRLSVSMDPSADENMNWLLHVSHASPTRMPALRQLDLCTCSIDGTALAPFIRALHQLPQVTALSLSSPRLGFLGAQFFDLLAAGPGTTGAWILPRLQALCLRQCTDVTGHELLRVVSARNGASFSEAKAIKYLKISQCDAFDSEVLDQLHAVVDCVKVI
ncbi:uncharacterized protein LAESUDRAFT_684573 [Laetiporus sulphureus 93-53]|uniref:F-box domain-containing protein n=1 Tax=Laetiporus sulphureus 93-53 TaxID=1314785 RepID=A0A165CKT5_9APHY|nr:uncharacterized protein LAESUDRAFT_684573 [Laetiporus sulphureus 93-53]KZT02989.1 hypothetical protein LAESUDRAFT_684573 [Laetiporus sulphureus 93-53]